MELCKVRYDGSHYLVAPYTNVSTFSTEDIINKTSEELGELNKDKKDYFINLWAREYFPSKNKGRKKKNLYFEKLMDDLRLMYISLINENKKEIEIVETLYDCILCDYEMIEYYNLTNEKKKEWLFGFIVRFIKNEKENLKSRKQLFKRKALNNDWNYFVTFTYDDKKHNEETFVKTLKKKLQNYHTNYGWLYMGCFERSKTDRLHFHGLLLVPNGMMRGKIREESYYDTTSHKKAISFINEEFECKIGRNDFKPITKSDLTFTNSLDYILKYIGKSDEKIVYSRGIKDDFYSLVDIEDNLICKINDNSPYYILGDTSFIELDKNLDKIN